MTGRQGRQEIPGLGDKCQLRCELENKYSLQGRRSSVALRIPAWYPSGAKQTRNPRLQVLPLGNKKQLPGEEHTGAKQTRRERDGTSRQAGMGKDKDLGATSTSISGYDSPPSILFCKSYSTHSFCWSLWLSNYQTCISMSICLCNRWTVSMTTLLQAFAHAVA